MKTQRLVLLVALLAPLGLLPLAASVPSSAAVLNKVPDIQSVSVAATVTPTAGGTTSVAATIVASDNNGANDLLGVTLQVLKPDSSVHTAAGAATLVSSSGKSATWTRTFTMAFHDDPGTYKLVAVVTDKQSATGDNVAAPQTFAYATLAALSLGAGTLGLGSIEPGAASTVQAIGVQNHGNVRIDVQVNGTALSLASPAASLPVGSLKYSGASDMSGAAALSATPATLGAFDLAKGPSSSQSLYWRLDVPDGDAQYVPPGTYTGDLTIGAVAG